MSMTFEALKDRLNEIAEELLEPATATNVAVFGLDMRAGRKLWLTEEQDAIVVSKDNDERLQYYGGFRDVDPSFRLELGDYVLYSDEDPRVAEHIAIAIDAMEEM